VSISHRRFRALVLQYVDAGADGVIDSAYVVRASPDADQMWWCSRGEEGGTERTVAAKPEHTDHEVFGFAAEVTVTVNDALLIDGETFVVRSLESRRYGIAETQVHAERVTNLVLTTT